MEPLRAIIVERIPVLREYLVDLSTDLCPELRCSIFADSQTALASIGNMRFDFAIIDVPLSDTGAIEVVMRLTASKYRVKVLFLSDTFGPLFVSLLKRVLPQGMVFGCLRKSADDAQIRFAIKSLLYYENSYMDRDLVFPTAISEQELLVLNGILAGISEVGIAKRLSVSSRTIRNRLRDLSHKLLDEHSRKYALGKDVSLRHLITAAAIEGNALSVLGRSCDEVAVPHEEITSDKTCTVVAQVALTSQTPIS